ncbi:hypothetical protein N7509_010093 [Penicillium cosmopolitanum]|uniref:AAA+ ATPase domain-containing protein n=1 Tax=Penicillium cosmopolitanum TaxID=1131564 RepID=A0A9W9VQM7_9EURO|nr:uncharacterized protein N7509_010093 [Penicillium cosmopolitanum]KAJ5387552.1 hypothetical protein N7509_010093 [Penicillium cosmopolitanum]
MYLSMQQVRLPIVRLRPCRLIARRRFPEPAPARRFHLSRQWLSSTSPDGPTPPTSTDARDVIDNRHSDIDNSINDTTATSVSEKTKPPARQYGSAVRRAMRNRQTEQQQQQKFSLAASIPTWFKANITHGSPGQADLLQSQHQLDITKSKSKPGPSPDNSDAVGDPASGGNGGDPSAGATPSESSSDNRYSLAEPLWEELRASVKAGLRLPPTQYAKEPSAKKSHLVLQYPGNDGILFLRLCHIAQLFSEHDLAESGATSAIRSLGYEVYRPAIMAAFAEPAEGGDADEDIPEIAGAHPGTHAEVSTPRFITIEASRESGDIPLPNWLGLKSLVASINGQPDQEPNTSRGYGQRMEQRWIGLLNELLYSASGASKSSVPKETKAESEEAQQPLEPVTEKPLPRDTIIHIQDYREIQSSREGSRVITLLQKVIQERRRAGSRVLLIGSTSQELQHTNSRDGPKILQNVFDDQFSKTLVIIPSMDTKTVEKTFSEDHQKRTMEINTRHLQTMLRYRLSETSSAVKDDIFGTRDWPLDPSTVKQSGMRERFWSYNQVHWLSTLALGSAEPDEPFGFEHIRRGIELMDGGDRVTSDWLQEKSPKASEPSGQTREQLLKSLRQTCTTHEKKLLNGVVDANSIRTTFNDVHVLPETVEALKTLTSLSLIRPEAFTYGVLATDKIPGCLLYGPPGTGKTLLAKAVARESGATVLEVSGSEVYDMYVGEGEKNVKAIFTLAKKLSPCVVFIDEADAIFCSRTGASSRTSHRELINQFLREWDGMNDMSAFIMVATNRPFDLRRRCPPPLLVDLPTEEDRHAILKIHLKEEQLDSAVDLADLAHRTPLYSGSDLKNLSVAAALACVREENKAALEHKGDEAYQYPERRTLTPAHFELGMQEISASISEDMSSLSAIRKFDEQYGDRKAQRKKNTGWGFIPAGSEESREETARVRTA